jgi:superfamily II DNA or RNA helicase
VLALVPLAAWLAGGLVALLGGALGTWSLGRTGRLRRAVRAGLGEAVAPAEALGGELERREQALRAAAAAHARASRERAFRAASLEELREHGAAGARLEALREAGYRSPADLAGLPAAALQRVRGVGRETARRVVRAVGELRRAIDARPVPLPGPEPSGEEEVRLADAALDVLDGREVGRPALARAEEELAPLRSRAAALLDRTGFLAWSGGGFRSARAEAAAKEAQALLEGGLDAARTPSVTDAERALDELEQRRRRERAEDRRLRRYQERFAECTALVEEALGEARGPARLRRGRGGLADEVVRRVEEASLDLAGLRATLRPYQSFGARFLLVQERAVLGDEMGLGKTVQALALMVHLAASRERPRFLVVAPAGLLVNWEREVRRFTALEPRLLHGEAFEPSLRAWLEEGGVGITSYTTLRVLGLGGLLEEAGARLELCVADEAHYAKNPEAGRTRELRRVLALSERGAILSGTPMENHPREFLELVRGLRPAGDGALEGLGLEEVRDGSRAGAFAEASARLYLRRNQEDVLTELPERLEVEEWVEPGAGELAAYREEVQRGNAMGMRRAVTMGAGGESSKLARLDELLAVYREEGRKVLVFSYFLDVLHEVARRPGAVEVLSGALDPAARQALCDRFQAGEGFALLPAQIVAGGVGLNLQAASVVVLCEPQLKPSTEEQAIARAHRMGQTRRVLVHRLLARGTCDEVLLELVAGKAALFDAYARQSRVADLAPAARDGSEAEVGRRLVEVEQRRLAAGAPGPGHGATP